MKKRLVAGMAAAAFCGAPALAADLPTKSPIYRADPAPIGYDWTGFYVGGNVGYGWRDSSYSFSADNGAGQGLLNTGLSGITPQSGSFRTSGFIGGGQLGYNWQFDRTWVAGIEADVAFSNVRGNGSPAATTNLGIGGIQPAFIPAGRNLDWFGTLRARLGVLPTDRLLIFATGGLAYGKTSANASIAIPFTGAITPVPADGSTLTCVGLVPCVAASGSRTSVGWTIGGGLEYAVWNNVSVKAEYLYVNLGSQTIHLSAVPPATGTGSVATAFNDAAYNIVRVGLNYKFGSQ